jgi:hypothetical protein
VNKYPMSRPYFISQRPRIVRLLLTHPILDLRYHWPAHSIGLSLYDYLIPYRPDYFRIGSHSVEQCFRWMRYTYIHQLLKIEEYD